jgi:nitrate reductase delta subunit
MDLPATPPSSAARTLRVLARLLRYPDAELRAHLAELRGVLHAEAALSTQRLGELDALLGWMGRQEPLDLEAGYVQLFDSGRRTALHLFEHVHGDSRERGPAMIDLAQTYEKAGLYLAEGEMPDHLPVLLEFASTQPPREAVGLLGEVAHLLNGIGAALEQRASRYASVMHALLDLAGVPVRAVPVPAEGPLDAGWDEPAAFDGCSGAGQACSGSAQPVHVIRRRTARRPGATS